MSEPELPRPNNPTPQPQSSPTSAPPPFPGQFHLPLNGGRVGVSGLAFGVQANIWNGPFPPPEAVNAYEKALPGAFDRILSMSERRQEVELQIAEKTTDASISDVRRAHFMGFAVAASSLAGGFYLVQTGHSAAGVTVILLYGAGAGLSFFLRRPVGAFGRNAASSDTPK